MQTFDIVAKFHAVFASIEWTLLYRLCVFHNIQYHCTESQDCFLKKK